MISDNEPLLTKFISVPKEFAALNCGAFIAGVVEGILDGAQFVSLKTIDLSHWLGLTRFVSSPHE